MPVRAPGAHRSSAAPRGIGPALLIGALLLTGCSAGSDTGSGTASGTGSSPGPSPAADAAPSALPQEPSPIPPASTPPASTPPVSPSPPPAAPARRVIAVTVAGGKVTGVESRVPAKLGERLEVRVTSDVAEQVHVHGYDLTADVAAGGVASIEVDATIPGGFEVELEKSHKTLFQLRVA